MLKKFLYTLLFLFAMLWVALGVGAWWLASHAVSLEKALPYMEQALSTKNIKVKIGYAGLVFDKRFLVRLDDVRVLSATGKTLAKVEKTGIALSNRNLFFGRLRPKHWKSTGVFVHLNFSDEGLFLGRKPIAVTEETQQMPVGIVEFLNKLETNLPIAASLKTIRLRNVHVLAKDKTAGVDWLFQDASLVLDKYKRDGETMRIAGLVRQKTVPYSVPVIAKATHNVNDDFMAINIRFEDSSTDFVREYIPKKLQELLKTRGRIELATRIGLQNKIEDPQFILSLGETSIFLEKAYTKPLKFSSIRLVGRYKPAPADVLTGDMLLINQQGEKFKITGQVSNLETDPVVDLRLTTPKIKLTTITELLPDRIIGKTVKWLNERTKNVVGENLVGTYKGRPSDMPRCKKNCGLTFTADITGGEVQFLENVEYATGVTGKFLLTEDYLNITANSATWAGQNLQNVSVTIDGLFTDIDSNLLIEGNGFGDLNKLLSQLDKGLDNTDIPTASGQSETSFKIKLPLKRDGTDAQVNEIKMDINSKITKLEFPLDLFEKTPFKAENAILRIKNTQLNLKAKGQIKNVGVDVNWRSSLKYPQSSGIATIKATVPVNLAQEYLDNMGVESTGSVKINGTLKQLSTDVFDIDTEVNLYNASFKIPKLNWQKNRREELESSLRGRITVRKNAPEIDMDIFTISGKNVEIAGSFYLAKGKKPAVQLSPFKIGGQNLTVTLLDDNLELIGKRFDAVGLDLFSNKQSDLPANFNIKTDVSLVALSSGGIIQNLKGNLNRKQGEWEEISIKGSMLGKGFNLEVTPTLAGKKVSLTAEDTGVFLTTLGYYDKLRGGRMRAEILVQPDKTGDGYVYIREARVMDMPILAQLLGLLSLEPLLDSKDGVRFREIKSSIKLKPDAINILDAKLDGPTMSMRFKGFYRFDNYINLDGRLIPAVVLNRTIAKIPLIGNILAGSQEGVLVADFKIKGDAADPKVSVKPLSLFTPGLIKDIFGGMFGGGSNDE